MSEWHPSSSCFNTIKTMKRVLAIFVAIVAFSGMASAQTLSDFLKGAATELIDKKTDGKVTEYLLAAKWDYAKPGVRLASEDELATLAGNAMMSSIEGKLTSAYALVGIKPGTHTVTLNDDKTFTMLVGRRNLAGTYTYDNTTHAIVFTFDSSLIKLQPLSGFAYLNGDSLDIVYDCSKLMNFLTALGSKVNMLNSLTTFLENYDNVYVGYTFNRAQ